MKPITPVITTRTLVPLILALAATLPTPAQDKKPLYPAMAPIDRYLMDKTAEIALAQSAAPPSISGDAEIMVLGRHGYESAIKGKNGFVCLVERSWTSGTDDPEFWNPKLRGPICFNPPAVRSDVPITLKKSKLLLAGRSKSEMFAAIASALDKREIPPIEQGSMCYMMSKQGYLNDRDGHWHPHLMFFVPLAAPATWGASFPGSPIYGVEDKEDRLTIFLVPIGSWSDGTPAPMDNH